MHGVAVLLILFVGISPLIAAVGAGYLGEAWSCDVDEGSPHPCVIGGTDYGEALYTLFVLGWFGLITVPLSFIVVLVYVAFATFLWARRR